MAGAWPGLVNAAPDDRLKQMQIFMREKMSHAQGALEGITLEKFDLASKSAIRLRNMTQTNAWFQLKNAEYMAQTKKFQANIDALILATADKDANASLAAYAKVSQSCVECHQMLRREQRRTP